MNQADDVLCLRPVWIYTVPTFGALTVAALAAPVAAMVAGRPLSEVLLTLVLLVVAALLTLNFVWIERVDFHNGAVRRISVFCVIRRTLPVSRAMSVSADWRRNDVLMRIDRIVISSPEGEITLSTSIYWPGELKKLVIALRDSRAEVDSSVSKLLKVD